MTTPPDDVTGRYYSSDPAIARKREMMLAWTAWLEEWCAEAIRRDGLLSDQRACLRSFSGRNTGTSAGRSAPRMSVRRRLDVYQ